MNSINMLDNMDGITTTISMCIIICLLVVISLEGVMSNIYYILILTGVLGSLSGFLYFNWNPARVYMGDTGSQFLGIFLASTSIIFLWNIKAGKSSLFDFKQIVLPLLIFIIPLIDTTTVTIRRLLRRQSPFVGGKDHITHHMAYLGISERGVAIILIFISLLSLPIVLLLLLNIITWTATVTFAVICYFLIVFTIFQLIYTIGERKYQKSKARVTLT
jgi:UDP-GlcNAc:undecaprenyl-phosphate/decaprenyl-phosphate GlcNAc-1-phosphate transferase